MYIILSEQCIFFQWLQWNSNFFLDKMAPPEQYNSFNIGSAERVQFFFYNGSARAMYFLKKWHHWSSAIF